MLGLGLLKLEGGYFSLFYLISVIYTFLCFMKRAQCEALLLVLRFVRYICKATRKLTQSPSAAAFCFLTFSTLCVSSTARPAPDLAGLCSSVPPLAQSRSSQSLFKSSRLFRFTAPPKFRTSLCCHPRTRPAGPGP
jgi:hypothetical protein